MLKVFTGSDRSLPSRVLKLVSVQNYSPWVKGEGSVSALKSSANTAKEFHTSCASCGKFWESNPKGDYRDEKFHEELARKQRENLWGLKDGFKDLRMEILKWTEEFKGKFDDSDFWIVDGDKTKVFTFENADKLKEWTTTCDSDHNEGFSRCELTISPTGKGLFRGFINTTPPKDGRIKYAGFCSMKSYRPMKSFARKSWHDWTSYTHLIMRVRGDGRNYMINLGNAGTFDITWNDCYHYVLHTRGGPYWQNVKIPFSKFYMASKGRVQDIQDRVMLDRISNVQLVAGKVDGPFCLEIDYIGVECDEDIEEEFAYENYRIPKFIANV